MTTPQVLYPQWIIPVTAAEIGAQHASVLTDHGVLIEQGRIQTIAPRDRLQVPPGAEIVELPDHALIPGLINTHTHAAMSLFQGLADDLPLMEWLSEHVWPAEQQWVSETFVRDGTFLAMAEMLRSGTTCFNDMYFFPNVVCKAAHEVKIRAHISFPVLEFPSAWARNAEEYIHKGLQVHDDHRHHDLIKVGFGPHAPYTVFDPAMERIRTLADELDTHIHIHLHETEHEVIEALEQNRERPIDRLHRLGLLKPNLHGVHMTALTEGDIEKVKNSGAHVVHCPESNLKLASGFSPVQHLLDEGMNVALGTDGAASNNDLDMIGEMRTAALLGKAVAGDAAALSAKTVLEMATLHAARAFGMDDEIGSLEPGKSADITAVRLNQLETQPMYNPVSQLVYATTREQVTDVWVAGERLLKSRQLTTLDPAEALEKAKDWAQKIGQADAQRD